MANSWGLSTRHAAIEEDAFRPLPTKNVNAGVKAGQKLRDGGNFLSHIPDVVIIQFLIYSFVIPD